MPGKRRRLHFEIKVTPMQVQKRERKGTSNNALDRDTSGTANAICGLSFIASGRGVFDPPCK